VSTRFDDRRVSICRNVTCLHAGPLSLKSKSGLILVLSVRSWTLCYVEINDRLPVHSSPYICLGTSFGKKLRISLISCMLLHKGGYGLDGPGIESRWRWDFFAPVQTCPGAHPASCTMGTGSFSGVKSGWGVTLTPHPLLSAVVRKE